MPTDQVTILLLEESYFSGMYRFGDLVAPSEQANWVLIVGNKLCGKKSLRERKFQEDISRKTQDEESILKKTEEVLKNKKIMKKELFMTENLLKMKLELIAQ